MARPGWLVPCFWLALSCEPTAVVGFSDAPGPTAVYETVEFVFEAKASSREQDNPFTWYPTMRFHRQGSLDGFSVLGFYDGNGIWRARFMPNQPGTWSYDWEFRGTAGSGEFVVDPRQDAERHGHVRVLDGAPGILAHDDGTPHYWFGGKWFSARNYGPKSKGSESNLPGEGPGYDAYYSDQQFADYVDVLTETHHNGVLLKIGGLPLENDQVSWDLEWIERADRWVAMLNERNIYVQINLFDPWSRTPDSYFEMVHDVERHLLPAWGPQDADAKEHYLRNVVARFAGYSNVYWELVNRIDERGTELGDAFVEEAPFYLSTLRTFDPYDLPIGASDVARAREIHADIEFARESPETPSTEYPRILNELVQTFSASFGCSADEPAHDDRVIRDPANRTCYRAAFWSAFVDRAFGTSEASWLDLKTPVDDVVRDVMLDQSVLRSVIDELSVPLDELWNNPGFVDSTQDMDCAVAPNQQDCRAVATTGHVGTRASHGRVYVSYFRYRHEAGAITVRLPTGVYRYRWLDPAHDADAIQRSGQLESREGQVTIDRPAFEEDIVLIVEFVRPLETSPM